MIVMIDIYELELKIQLINLQIYNQTQILDITIIQNGNSRWICSSKLVDRMLR